MTEQDMETHSQPVDQDQDQDHSEYQRSLPQLGKAPREQINVYSECRQVSIPTISEPQPQRQQTDLSEVIQDLEARIHALNKTTRKPPSANMAGNNTNSFPLLDTSFNNRSPSPAGSQINGAGAVNNGANYMQPLPVGHQQDLNYLYAQIQELSSVLQANRDKVNEITHTAEEVARRANQSNGVSHENGDHEADKSRIRELEHELAKSNKIIDLYKHEQRENTSLIAQYEEALGTATEQIRNYCNDIDTKFLAQRRHYNNLLQAEKDEHLQSRLDRDHWMAQTLKVCEMIRTAARLRNDEWQDEYRVVRGLQEEVRCLRNCLGMEPEKLEEETGWPYIREDPSQIPQGQSQS